MTAIPLNPLRKGDNMRPTLLHPSATSRPVSSGRLLAYVVREHRRGRPLRDILGDGFVIDHATNAEVGLLLENPHLIKRLVDETLSSPEVPDPLPPAA
jgi:hypothetical protein